MDKSVQMSVPASRVVCGYEIKKMPLGAYLRATEELRTLPVDFLGLVLPSQGGDGLIAALSAGQSEAVQAVLAALLTAAPDAMLYLVSTLTGVDRGNLENDPNIGLTGIVEIINAWIEVNDLAGFIRGARDLAESIRRVVRSQQQKIGSKG